MPNAKSHVMVIDGYLAAGLLVGLLNAIFCLWRADPLSALVEIYYTVTERVARGVEESA